MQCTRKSGRLLERERENRAQCTPSRRPRRPGARAARRAVLAGEGGELGPGHQAQPGARHEVHHAGTALDSYSDHHCDRLLVCSSLMLCLTSTPDSWRCAAGVRHSGPRARDLRRRTPVDPSGRVRPAHAAVPPLADRPALHVRRRREPVRAPTRRPLLKDGSKEH